jgi:hypothetical protein
VPVWLRYNEKFLKTEATREIRMWSSLAKTKASSVDNKNSSLKSNTKNSPALSLKQEKATETKSENQDMPKSISNEIESELNEIEKKWKETYHVKEEETKPLEAASGSVQKDKTKDADELLRKKFLISMDIHKKPTDLTLLKQIFTFKLAKKEPNEEVLNTEEKTKTNIFEIEDSHSKLLLFIEYIVERLNDLLTDKTKAYMHESTFKHKLNKQREEDEYSQKYDQIITEKAILFHKNDRLSEQLVFDSEKIILNTQKINKSEANDNGEAEMEAKLKEFSHIIEKKTSDTAESSFLQNLIHNDDGKKKNPVPDYKKLREEAMQQQLKIKEFFIGLKPSKPLENQRLDAVTIEDLNESPDGSENVFKQDLIFKIRQTNEEIVRIFPTVDSKSQMQIRRKIFYDKLIK